MLVSSLAVELYEPTHVLLRGAKHNLFVDGLDWAPDEWQEITDDKISNGARDLSNTVAEELEQFGIGSLDEVLQTTRQHRVRFSVLTLLVLGEARTMRSGIVSG